MLHQQSRNARHLVVMAATILVLQFMTGCQTNTTPSDLVPQEQHSRSGIPIERLGGGSPGGALAVAEVSINGVEGRFLLDTGASHSVFSPDFATALGLPAIGHISGNDSGGAIVHGSVLAPVRIAGPGLAAQVTLDQPLVLDTGPLKALGLDGVVSPQSLAGDGCVLLDFAAGKVSLDTTDPQGCLSGTPQYSQESLAGTIKRPVIAVSIGTPPATPTPFLVDTGAQMTSLMEHAAQDLPRLGTQQSQGVTGTKRTRALAGPVTLSIGPYQTTLDQVAVETAEKELSKLAMDVLGTAKIVLTADNTVILKF